MPGLGIRGLGEERGQRGERAVSFFLSVFSGLLLSLAQLLTCRHRRPRLPRRRDRTGLDQGWFAPCHNLRSLARAGAVTVLGGGAWKKGFLRERTDKGEETHCALCAV